MKRTNKKYTYEEVKHYIEVEINCGYKLLSDSYENCRSKIKVMCNKGHIFYPEFRNILHNNTRCFECFGKKKYTLKQVQDIFKNEGCKLLSEVYNNNYENLEYECSCGETSTISLTNFLSGHRCQKCGQSKRETTNMQKYGVKCTSQNEDVRKKQIKSLFRNGTQKTSKQQLHIHQIIGGVLNFPFSLLSLDIAFPEKKIYVEYDGGFHNGRVQFGLVSEEEFANKERKRSCLLSDNGWREIRIISLSDKLPIDDIIINMLDYAIKYIDSGHSWIKFDIDNSIVINSQGSFHYNYGELKSVA